MIIVTSRLCDAFVTIAHAVEMCIAVG